MRPSLLSLLGITVLVPATQLAQTAPVTTPVPTIQVLAIGHVTPGPEAATPNPKAIRAIMPDEVKATVDLYLEGKIAQWFVRQDGKGVVFLLNATSPEQADAMLRQLPLVKAGRLQFDLMPLGPLSPLRYLTGEANSAPRQ